MSDTIREVAEWEKDEELLGTIRAIHREMRPSTGDDRIDGWAIARAAIAAWNRRAALSAPRETTAGNPREGTMEQRWRCPNGHEWSAANGTTPCPTCGSSNMEQVRLSVVEHFREAWERDEMDDAGPSR